MIFDRVQQVMVDPQIAMSTSLTSFGVAMATVLQWLPHIAAGAAFIYTCLQAFFLIKDRLEKRKKKK